MGRLPGLAVALLVGLSGCALPLTKAAADGNLDQVRALIDQGAAVDALDGWSAPSVNMNALMSASYYGKEAVVRLLIDKGADVNASGPFFTPLVAAAWGGQARVAELLIEKGADADTAIARMEKHRDSNSRDGVSLLRRLAPKKQAAPQGVSKEEIASIVQAAVQGAAKSAPAPARVRLVSDIEQPGYRLPERPLDFAVVVGIEKYSDIPDAQFAQRDSEAVARHLIAMGVPSRNVVHVAGDKAGYKSLEKFVEAWLPRNVGPESRVYFYFSGHGAPDPATGQAYLLPWDGDPSFLEQTGYPLKRLYEKLGALKARQVIVALDACFSGAGGRSVLAKGARPLVTQVEAVAVPPKLTIFAAASADQITSTREDVGHGTFTYHFVKGLSGGAKGAGGAVTTQGLFDYLKPKVADDARRQNREQTPVLQGVAQSQELARFK